MQITMLTIAHTTVRARVYTDIPYRGDGNISHCPESE